jgi:hypothetical protein
VSEIKLLSVCVQKGIKDNKNQDNIFSLTISYDFFGNKYDILKNSPQIKVGDNSVPVKVRIFDVIKDSQMNLGVEVPFSILFYETLADYQSNAKFIDLIYEIDKNKKTKTYKVIKEHNNGNWEIKDIKEPNVSIKLKEK